MILLLSDGSNNAGVDPMVAAAQAKAEHVRVYTIAFGTPNGVISAGAFGQIVRVPPDPTALRAVAKATGGEFFTAADVDTLKRVYKNIGSQVGTTTEHQDVSYAFAGVGGRAAGGCRSALDALAQSGGLTRCPLVTTSGTRHGASGTRPATCCTRRRSSGRPCSSACCSCRSCCSSTPYASIAAAVPSRGSPIPR